MIDPPETARDPATPTTAAGSTEQMRPPLDRDELSRINRIPLRSGRFVLLFALTCVLAVVGSVASAVGATTLGGHGLGVPGALTTAVLLGAVLLVVGELVPIQVPRSDDTTTQTHFSMTVATVFIASGPVWLVMLCMGLTVAFDDLRHRRAMFKVVFNVAQYLVSISTARAVFCLVTDTPFAAGPRPLDISDVPAMLLAGVALVVANETQVTAAASLLLREPPWETILHDVRMTMIMNLVLVGISPVLGYLMFSEPALVPFMLFPALAILYSSRIAAHRHRVSLTDSLTGLPNRTMLNQSIAKALADYRGGGAPVAVLLLDVDYFKDVNDALGHHTGDLLLTELARRARRFTDGPGELAARLGGDEFALLLRGQSTDLVTLDARARSVAGQLLATLNEPLDLGGVRLSVQCSVGVVVVGTHDLDTTEVIKRADLAMYQAKQERARYAVFDANSPSGSSAARLSLLADLRDAVRVQDLEVHYQPLVDGSTGAMVGAEALCRWHHAGHGWLSPSVFIPLAESAGMIDQLTQQVLEQALADVRMWRDNGLDLQVSVNLSARLVSDASIPSVVDTMLARYGIDPRRLTIEVTESSVVTDPSRAMVVLSELRRIGVRLSMDDFGTGYSSLALLQQLEVDELKVDRSFVSDLDTVTADAILVRSTVDLAHSLGLEVVAEGVERTGVARQLRDMGCDRLQGYLYGSAMSAEEILALGTTSRQGVRTDRAASEGKVADDLGLDLTDDRTMPSKRTMRLPGPRSSTMME